MSIDIFLNIVLPVFSVLAFLTFFAIIPLWIIVGKLREHETKEDWERNVAQLKNIRRGALNNPEIISDIFKKKEYPYYYLLAGVTLIIILYFIARFGN